MIQLNNLEIDISFDFKYKSGGLLKYLNSHNLSKIDAQVTLGEWRYLDSSKFEKFIQAVFSYVNIKKLNLYQIWDYKIAGKLYKKIKNCHSLRYVEFHQNKGIKDRLDIIEANLNVR